MEALVWWLSFFSPDRRLTGACIVRAVDEEEALMVAWDAGAVPTIHAVISGVALSEREFRRIPFAMDPFVNRLLGRDEARTLVEQLCAAVLS